MKTLKPIILVSIIGLLIIANIQAQENKPKQTEKKRDIEIVFAIDVSGSMHHIIAAAQKKIWAIVNQMLKAKPMPNLRVGLIAYRGENEECYGGIGFKVWDLTNDLDDVYTKLMALRTGGGNIECVGRAIYEATNSINWSKSKDALKILFILGNEPADQDTNKEKYGYKKVAPEAIKKGIIINTIYCGNTPGSERGWKDIALLADGTFTTIGIEGKIIDIKTPMDREIAKLNSELNETFVPYGKLGFEKENRMRELDKKAEQLSPSAAPARALYKAKAGFLNMAGDLVDAYLNGKIKLEELKKEDLPKELQNMSLDELKAYLDKKAKERKEIKKKLLDLGKKRDAYIKEEMKKLDTKDAFDQVILKTLRQQAEKKGFKFEE